MKNVDNIVKLFPYLQNLKVIRDMCRVRRCELTIVGIALSKSSYAI